MCLQVFCAEQMLDEYDREKERDYNDAQNSEHGDKGQVKN